MATDRQKAIDKALRGLFPLIPYLDAAAVREAARSRHFRSVSPERSVWLAAIAHIRHQYTDYDTMRDDGYDRDSALYFIVEDINLVLGRWGATRQLVSVSEAEPLED